MLRRDFFFFFNSIPGKSISGGLWTQSRTSTGGSSRRNCSTKVAVEVRRHVDRRMHPSSSTSIFATIVVFAVNEC